VEYSKRLDACLKTIGEKQRLHVRLGNGKLMVIIAGLVMAWFVIYPRDVSPFWLLLPVAAYFALAVLHNNVTRMLTRTERVAALYRRGLDRIEDRWAGGGETGERFKTEGCLCAEDLDLFGKGSLFELLSTARTTMGEAQLARWLLHLSPPAEIKERHVLIAELRDNLDLREDLGVAGGELRAALNPEALTAWAGQRAAGCRPGLRWIFAALVTAAIALAVLLVITGIILPLLAVITAEVGLTLWMWKSAVAALHGLDSTDQSLLLLSHILRRIEAEPFASAGLQGLMAGLQNGDSPPSRAVQDLAHLVNWTNARDSLLVRILDIPMMYTMQAGFAAEAWRRRHGHHLGSWLEVIGEVEAVLSLATYAYEHPRDPFPCLLEQPDPFFAGEELGHPLIPSSTCVRNSIQLSTDGTQLLIVSGSNMSGKSTLLRTIGINTVLAMAGAPVRAKSLTLTPLTLGTSIRSTDSLQEGRSGFYTEILRLRDVFQLTESSPPVLFLFDELLGGTNSTDRRAGAEALARELIVRGAIGIVTTHDMALTEISPPSCRPGSIANAHFQEGIQNARMVFDYKLRTGVVEKGNALDLMRMIGLKV
jgi:hypothetical protein